MSPPHLTRADPVRRAADNVAATVADLAIGAPVSARVELGGPEALSPVAANSRPRSRWSAVNRERARRLIAEGRMKTAGLTEYQAAKADGRLDAAYAPQSKATVPEDFRAALHEDPEANEFFRALGGGDRYKFLYWLHHTRDPKRRAERIAHYIELLSRRRTLARD